MSGVVTKLERFGHARVASALAAGAAVVSLAYLIVSRPPFANYNVELSAALLHRGSLSIEGVETSYYEPFYPIFLAAARFAASDRLPLLQAIQGVVLSAAGAVSLYLLTRALTGRRTTAVLSGILYGMYPLLIWHAATPDESALLSTLLILFACAVVRARTIPGGCAAGVCLGLAVLTRSVALPLVILGPLVMSQQRRVSAALACAVVAIALISPFCLRNYRLAGTLFPTRSGLNFFIGNSRYAAALLPTYTPDNLQVYAEDLAEPEVPPDLPAPQREAAMDRALTRLALQEIRARPLQTLRLKARYVLYFFWPGLVPSHVYTADTVLQISPGGAVSVLNSPARPWLESLAFTASYCPVLLAAVVGVWKRGTEIRRDAILWAILLSFVAVHALYFPTTRYTAPTAFVLLFYAAIGLAGFRPGETRST